MRIGIKVFATLTKYFPSIPLGQVIEVELDDGDTLGDLLKKIGIPEHEVKIALRNGKPCALSQVLAEGDILSLFPSVAGG